MGLGNTAEEAYRAFLLKAANVTIPTPPTPEEMTLQDMIDKADTLLKSYTNALAQGKFEDAGRYLEEFLKVWGQLVERSRGVS